MYVFLLFKYWWPYRWCIHISWKMFCNLQYMRYCFLYLSLWWHIKHIKHIKFLEYSTITELNIFFLFFSSLEVVYRAYSCDCQALQFNVLYGCIKSFPPKHSWICKTIAVTSFAFASYLLQFTFTIGRDILSTQAGICVTITFSSSIPEDCKSFFLYTILYFF